jgi:hypothetical protein
MRRLLLFGLLFLLVLNSVNAQYLVSNSNDWKDVYSVELYGNLMNLESKFLTGTRHASILHFSLPDENIEVISSSNNPVVVGYDTILIGQGTKSVVELSYSNVNLELARRLDNINKFIIVDPSYGYNV